jgi:hypothetical protein
VTSIVAATVDGGGGGIYNFDITESGLGSSQIDGEALVVVYENASLSVATVGILDGFASVNGDTASINFADSLDPTDPGFFAEMSLGIAFSCCDQKSTVKVNGILMTGNAGNNDDSTEALANGNLITVGSFDDAFSPANPSYLEDTERYDLSNFVSAGDTSIVVENANASKDDNIFLATFYVSGVAGINEDPIDPIIDPIIDPPTNVPEPSILALIGLGLLGVTSARTRRRRS